MDRKINMRGSLCALGIGIFNLIFYKHMLQAGYDVSWKIISKNPDFGEYMKLCSWFDVDETELAKSITKPFHEDTPVFSIWHPHDIMTDTEGLPVKALIHFETDSFTPEEKAGIEQVSGISCCSNWGLSVLMNEFQSMSTDIPCALAPGIYASLECKLVDSQVAAFKKSIQLIKHTYGYEAVVMSGGKWEKRKQQFRFIDGSLTSPRKALIIGLWSNPFLNGLEQPKIALKNNGYELKDRLNIGYGIVIERYTHKDQSDYMDIALCDFIDDFPTMEAFVKSIDGYMSIGAGEGWDQPLVEAIGLGVPCLATWNTAHKEYCNRNGVFRVSCDKEIANDGIWFHGNRGNWFPPNEYNLSSIFHSFITNITEKTVKPVTLFPTLTSIHRKFVDYMQWFYFESH